MAAFLLFSSSKSAQNPPVVCLVFFSVRSVVEMTFETDIQSVLKDLSSKDWNVRFRSLEKLQVLVQDNVDNTGVWTKEVLISLHKPLMTQLKDLRSSIVREVRF